VALYATNPSRRAQPQPVAPRGSNVFIGRQPIFDRVQRLVAYEVLFRAGEKNAAEVIDGARATATVMLNALTEIGLDRLVGAHVAWINLTRDAVLSGLGLTLPPAVTCFEILEDQMVDDDLVEAVAELRELGYQIALDDFEPSAGYERLLPHADYVKLDYAALGPTRFAQHFELLAPYDLRLLAEKVETREEHNHCMALGCHLFQGFYYQKPEVLTERRIELSRGSVFQLIVALQNPYIELEDLEPLIARDVPLSLRLLRYLNSAFLGLACKVTSVRHGLIMLGVENVRRWATLTVMSSMEGGHPELTVAALLRARFCELAGVQDGLDGAKLFTVGMFSLLDAMMGADLDELLADLPFPQDIRGALLERAGPMGAILNDATALEAGTYDESAGHVRDAGSVYVEALLWAQEAAATLSDSLG
jgi:EAL and modified HD-GYP domain-containing signal transduction protein